MDIEEAVRTYLLTNTSLTTLISTRIVPDIIKDGTSLPVVVYTKISDVKDHKLTGQYSEERPVIQYTAFATTKSSARAIAAEIKESLVDYSGTLSGITVQHIKLLNEGSDIEQSGEEKLFYEDLEFEITYERT